MLLYYFFFNCVGRINGNGPKNGTPTADNTPRRLAKRGVNGVALTPEAVRAVGHAVAELADEPRPDGSGFGDGGDPRAVCVGTGEGGSLLCVDAAYGFSGGSA